MATCHFNLRAILQMREIVGGSGIIKHHLESSVYVCVFTEMGRLNIGAKTGNNYSNVKCIIPARVWMLESARQ